MGCYVKLYTCARWENGLKSNGVIGDHECIVGKISSVHRLINPNEFSLYAVGAEGNHSSTEHCPWGQLGHFEPLVDWADVQYPWRWNLVVFVDMKLLKHNDRDTWEYSQG